MVTTTLRFAIQRPKTACAHSLYIVLKSVNSLKEVYTVMTANRAAVYC